MNNTLTNKNKVSQAGQYCGSDGELVNMMPIQSHRSYCLYIQTAPLIPNEAGDLSFQIVDDQGNVLKDFETVHEKIMHVILIRKDLVNFQHLHPSFDTLAGTFTIKNVSPPADGPYRVFADFTPSTSQLGPDGTRLPVVDHDDLEVGSVDAYKPTALGVMNEADDVDTYNIALTLSSKVPFAGQNTTLTFTITENGKKVTDLEKYLGELGHAVVLKDGDLSFLHTHPMDQKLDEQNGTIAFQVTFPEPGRYKSFMQFQHRDQVQTAAFVLPEVAGKATKMESQDSGMFHENTQNY